MSSLDEDDHAAIAKTYHSMDENGDGRVSMAEVKRASKRIGIDLSTDKLKQMMRDVDKNGDGYLDLSEFEKLITEYMKHDPNDIKTARKIFQAMDVDKDGKVTTSEIMKAMKVSKSDANDLLAEADSNKDGKMSFDEFVKVMKGQTG
ncbi:uncharacterized protein LOC134690550 [Mytilus trossulus]|uniref:uncharacterized protein LOC134690550 n=1 Tax=Mytilus trossulus TaxID=6551 RepID=UPI00300559CB